jgi:hypothetical protein
MKNIFPYILISISVLAGGAVLEWSRLRKFWNRSCTGRIWKKRYPEASKDEIRRFLDYFINAFAFSPARRLCFKPDDRIIDVYRARYPFPKIMADQMELESFLQMLDEHYHVDLLPFWREDVTLAELFELTHQLEPNKSAHTKA